MEDNPTPARKQTKAWIIIAIVAALLFTCLIAGLVGVVFGYIAGRSVARAELAPPVFRVEPLPERIPIPEMPGVVSGWALVVNVAEDSPADRAGLRVGDLITSVGGEPLRDGVSLADLIQQYRPGDEIELDVLRGRREGIITVTLGRSPRDRHVPWLGIEYRQIPAGPGTRLEVPPMRGQRLPFFGGSQ